MNIVPFGSCRVRNFFPGQVNDYECTHNTKQILQIISFLEKSRKMDIGSIWTLEFVLINRHCKSHKKMRKSIIPLREKIDNANIVVIEISSLKILHNTESKLHYFLDNYQYLGHIADCKSRKTINKLYKEADNIKKASEMYLQGKKEMFNDLDKICKYFAEKNCMIVLVPHLNFKLKNGYIKNRENICNWLKTFCKDNKDSHYFNPLDYISEIPDQEDINHYSDENYHMVKKSLGKFTNNLLKNKSLNSKKPKEIY